MALLASRRAVFHFSNLLVIVWLSHFLTLALSYILCSLLTSFNRENVIWGIIHDFVFTTLSNSRVVLVAWSHVGFCRSPLTLHLLPPPSPPLASLYLYLLYLPNHQPKPQSEFRTRVLVFWGFNLHNHNVLFQCHLNPSHVWLSGLNLLPPLYLWGSSTHG